MYIPQSSALINSRNSFIPLSRIRDSRAKEIRKIYWSGKKGKVILTVRRGSRAENKRKKLTKGYLSLHDFDGPRGGGRAKEGILVGGSLNREC